VTSHIAQFDEAKKHRRLGKRPKAVLLRNARVSWKKIQIVSIIRMVADEIRAICDAAHFDGDPDVR
jgi:hypothetical protein